MFPKNELIRLFGQGQIGMVIGMDKEISLGLKEALAVSEERHVVLRNILDATAVAGDGSAPAVLKPKVKVSLAVERFEHHDFMVSDQGNKPADGNQINQHLQNTG